MILMLQFSTELSNPNVWHLSMPVIKPTFYHTFPFPVRFNRHIIDTGSINFKQFTMPGNC